MFRINCKVGDNSQHFLLDGVTKKNSREVAEVLILNLSFEGQRPELISIEETYLRDEMIFHLMGAQAFAREDELVVAQEKWARQGLLTGRTAASQPGAKLWLYRFKAITP
jgi:hypothetical protein